MNALAQHSRSQQILTHKPTACFVKTEFSWNRALHICLCIIYAAFNLEQQRCGAATNTVWLAKPTIVTAWPFRGKVC